MQIFKVKKYPGMWDEIKENAKVFLPGFRLGGGKAVREEFDTNFWKPCSACVFNVYSGTFLMHAIEESDKKILLCGSIISFIGWCFCEPNLIGIERHRFGIIPANLRQLAIEDVVRVLQILTKTPILLYNATKKDPGEFITVAKFFQNIVANAPPVKHFSMEEIEKIHQDCDKLVGEKGKW